jgi:hypothetical protein
VGELHLGDPQGYLGNVGRIVLSDVVVQLGTVEGLVEINRAGDETPIKPTSTMSSHQITFAVANQIFRCKLFQYWSIPQSHRQSAASYALV